MRRGFHILLVLAAGLLAGCDLDAKSRVDRDVRYVNPERLDKGMIIILPGIEGESAANQDIRKGLDEGGIPYALAIYRWGFPVPGLGLLMNQTDVAGNRRAAQQLAAAIVRYQIKRPGKPIFLIGHSAGGGVAVFTLEALADMPDAKPVDGAFLLSSSISADYKLDKALTMTRLGIVNGFNPEDKALLGTGTALFGNVDGGHGDSAGRTGFVVKDPNRLFEFKINSGDVKIAGDPHFVVTNAHLIATHAPRWVLADAWPPPGRTQ